MKKALLIKLEAPSYSSIGMGNAFSEYFEVHSIDWQKVRFDNGKEGLNVLWELILSECLSFMPDLIFCQIQKEGILNAEQFKRLSDFGFVINYTEDVREDISWYEEVGEHIGLTIFTNKDDVKRFKHNNVGYMYVSYNDVWYKPQPKTEKDYGEIIFIGNNYLGTTALNFPQSQERQDMIAFMKEKFGERFQAYGMGFENQMLLPAQCVEAYNNCKVVITQNNFKRDGYSSDRDLNAMGCGAIVVHQYFEGIKDIFINSSKLMYWKNFNFLYMGCAEALDNYTPIFKEAIHSYTKQNHSWHNRIKFVIGMTKITQESKIYKIPIPNDIQIPIKRNQAGEIVLN